MEQKTYGQYCPLAMSAEILCKRWTLLILRELLDGSTGFNEISRGVPLISRTLLSNRLKDLSGVGLIRRRVVGRAKRAHYQLTEAGHALGPVVKAVAEWGQAWIDVEPSLKDVDTDFLMWDVRRNVRWLSTLPDPFVVMFSFSDAPEKKQLHWLVIEKDSVDLCYIEPDLAVDVLIDTDLRTFIKVWMGWEKAQEAIAQNRLIVDGRPEFTRDFTMWLGLSGVAGIEKRPVAQRVLRNA